jgi:hypothetical protein
MYERILEHACAPHGLAPWWPVPRGRPWIAGIHEHPLGGAFFGHGAWGNSTKWWGNAAAELRARHRHPSGGSGPALEALLVRPDPIPWGGAKARSELATSVPLRSSRPLGLRSAGVNEGLREDVGEFSWPDRGAPRNILCSWCGLCALPVSGGASLGEPEVVRSVSPDGKPRRASSTMSRPRGSVATSSPTDQGLEVEPPPGGERQGGTALRQRRAGCRGRTRSGGPRVGGEGRKPRRHARAPGLKPDEPQGR